MKNKYLLNMSFSKVVLINVCVFLFLLMAGELSIRAALTLRSCLFKSCNYAYITKLEVRANPETWSIGLSRYDPILGYVPRENFSGTINSSGWNNSFVSINEMGFRNNGNEIKVRDPKILVFGDSFTFGDQVSDNRTWPSCLERLSNFQVVNAGVSGYGAAQSLKRAEQVIKRNSYDMVIFSILVEDDFYRDRTDYNSGFPKPTLTKAQGTINWSPVSDPNRIGSKFSSHPPTFARLIYQHSILLSTIYDKLAKGNNIFTLTLTTIHPEAADEKDIIEWTLTEFSKIKVYKKLLVLQYGERLQDKNILEKRDFTAMLAKKLNLRMLDTYEVLNSRKHEGLWNGHYTELGNKIVCEMIYESFK